MGADVSRVRFDARNDVTKVVQQQGRVMLDADANEASDALDHRLRAQAADLGSFGTATGIAGTAVVPRTTPDAFRLTFSGAKLMLGRGRMYVDGLVAENHGTGADEFDPLLGDVRGAADTPYLDQPYLPAPPVAPATGRHLVYLEVREREVTWVEQPGLVDPAIAVDTTARTQVIWQARVHAPDAPGLTCSTLDADIPGWEAVIAPSTSRLTVSTVPVPPATDPCSLPPSGDYRGLENQTYRVQVHTPGPAGAATFTWSRDNASVTIPVTEVPSSTRLGLASLGKDADSLGLASGQWAEILDDDHELAATPGELRQITVHPEDRSISFTPALPAGWPATAVQAADRHLRVRRWDGDGAVAIPATPAAIELEHGIAVTLTGGDFRTGEYWIFAARTATTSVEKPTAAPPLGPHRHFARLGIIEGTTVIGECTPLWPPEAEAGAESCACTVCIGPEDHASGTFTIQDGLDQVARRGGTVCLEVGTYQLREPLQLTKAVGVRLRGQGVNTEIAARGDALVVQGSSRTTVEDLTIVSGGAAIRLVGCHETTLSALYVVVEGDESTGICLQDMCVGLHVHDGYVRASVGLHAKADLEQPLLLADVTIDGNQFEAGSYGILADDAVLHTHDVHVRANRIEAERMGGIRLGGALDTTGSVRVENNLVASRFEGVVVAGGMSVCGNRITAGERGTDDTRTGVLALASSLPDSRSTTMTCIADNIVTGFDRSIVVEGAAEAVRVTGNDVSGSDHGIAVWAKVPGLDVRVCDNAVHGIAQKGSGEAGVFGVLVSGAGTLAVTGNTVGDIGTGGVTTGETIGIGVLGTATCRMIGNIVYAVGPVGGEASTYDFAVLGAAVATIEGNQSLRDGKADGQRASAYGLFLAQDGLYEMTPGIRALGAASPGTVAFASDDFLVTQTLDERGVCAVVGDNVFSGGLHGAAVVARFRSGTVQLTHNNCVAPEGTRGAVRVSAPTAAVTGNCVRGGSPSMNLVVAADRLTVLGNLVSNGISAAGGLDPRWAPLNLDGVL